MKLNLKPNLKTKSLQINKDQSRILGIIVASTIVTVFCLVSAKVLVGQAMYQRRVVNARHASAKKLNDDIKNANTLVAQYNKVFIGTAPLNIIGGKNDSTANTVPPDGDNGRIVLDALPTSYDFPALLTSISKLLSSDGISSPSIGGTDNAGSINSDATVSPTPSKIDLTVSGTGTYSSVAKLLGDLQRSIRPMDVTHLSLSGSESNLTVTLNLSTYYQPAKTLTINGKAIK